jgi:hypothetical protein
MLSRQRPPPRLAPGSRPSVLPRPVNPNPNEAGCPARSARYVCGAKINSAIDPVAVIVLEPLAVPIVIVTFQSSVRPGVDAAR